MSTAESSLATNVFDEDWLWFATRRPVDTVAETEFAISALGLEPGARVLDVPCGHGRHSVELARRGFAVTGVDLSEPSLDVAAAAAARAGVELDLRRMDMRDLAFDGGFDAALDLFTSIGYGTEAEDAAVLGGIRRALRPDGALLLDTANRTWVEDRFAPRGRHDLADGTTLFEERSFDPRSARIGSRWTLVLPYGERRWGSFSHRLYTLPELAALVRRAGFDVEQTYSDLQGSLAEPGGARLVVVARAAG
jgi:SAM-dependent methyltransferase